MKKAIDTEFWEIVRALDLPLGVTGAEDVDRDSTLEARIDEYFADERQVRRAVLGIDIYKYSQMAGPQQRLVPFIFQMLYDLAYTLAIGKEQYLFQEETLRRSFIPTGDGGFQILDTPLHALAFASYFQLTLAAYNAHWHFPKLRAFVGPLTLRYALTFDELTNVHISSVGENFYGAAIINNARVLAKDTLNRFLVDVNSVDWLSRRFGSVESLLAADSAEISSLPELAAYDTKHRDESMLFPKRDAEVLSPIRVINLQKIGHIDSKGRGLDIYNLYLQSSLVRFAAENAPAKRFIVTLGNLNTSGLS